MFLQQPPMGPVSQALSTQVVPESSSSMPEPREADFPNDLRPSSSRRSFESERTVVGRGKAGLYKVVQNKLKLTPAAAELEPEPEKESVKSKWRSWNLEHQSKIKKDIARYIRTGTEDIVCKSCKRSISINKWMKHRTVYNYCKVGDKYLKFDNFKRDYPYINVDL